MIPRPSSLMFAIAFDLVVAEAAIHHPRGVTTAYMDIGFRRYRLSKTHRPEGARASSPRMMAG
jgi:hypothetical protein